MKQQKTRFYLIRHGETLWNKQKRYQGATDIALSEEGIAQAKLMAKRFDFLPLDAIYSSPLQRAFATAEEISKRTHIPVIKDEHFREIHFGDWEGKTVPELTETYGQSYLDFWEKPFQATFPGEGSFVHVAKRAVEGFELLLEKHKGEKVAIVSHGGFLRVMLVAILGMDDTFYRSTWLTNTSITMIDVLEDGKRILMTLNDKAHLELSGLFEERV